MNQDAHAGHEKEVENQELCNNRDLSNGISSRKKNEVIPNSRNEIFRKWKELDIPCIQNFSEEE